MVGRPRQQGATASPPLFICLASHIVVFLLHQCKLYLDAIVPKHLEQCSLMFSWMNE